jgi:hypothetical protein
MLDAVRTFTVAHVEHDARFVRVSLITSTYNPARLLIDIGD